MTMKSLLNNLLRATLLLPMLMVSLSCEAQSTSHKTIERHGWDNEALFPLYGDVKRLTEYQYFVDDKGKADKSQYWARRFTFNTHGDVVSEVMFNNTGNERIVQTSAYNAEGKITEYKEYFGDGNVELTHLYDYDAEGNLKRFTHLNQENKVREMRYYNAAGEIVEEVHYQYDGELELRRVVEVDAAGRRTKWIKETPYGTTEIIYDEAGKEVEKIYRDEIGRVTQRGEFIYDNHNRVTRENNYDGDGNLISYLSHTYSEDGTTIEEWSSESRKITKLDRWGDTTEHVVIYDNELTLWKYMKHYYVYVRDEQGRIIRRESYTSLAEGDKGELRGVLLFKYEDLPNEHRKITYFEDGTLYSVESNDDEGRLLRIEKYRNGKLIAREYNTYDKEGNIIDKGSYNIHDEGTPDEYVEEWQEQTRYGKYGVVEYKYYEGGKLVSHSTMQYDAKGNRISHKKISGELAMGYSVLYEYHIEYR